MQVNFRRLLSWESFCLRSASFVLLAIARVLSGAPFLNPKVVVLKIAAWKETYPQKWYVQKNLEMTLEHFGHISARQNAPGDDIL